MHNSQTPCSLTVQMRSWVIAMASAFTYQPGGFTDSKLSWSFKWHIIKQSIIFSKTQKRKKGCILWTQQKKTVPTNDNEGVIDVNTSKAIRCFADVGPCIICFHLFDLQAHAEDTETNPATVDVTVVFGPHNERWGVSFNRAWHFDGTAQPCRLPVSYFSRHPRRPWGNTKTLLLGSVKKTLVKC